MAQAPIEGLAAMMAGGMPAGMPMPAGAMPGGEMPGGGAATPCPVCMGTGMIDPATAEALGGGMQMPPQLSPMPAPRGGAMMPPMAM